MTVYLITGARAGIGLEYVRQLSLAPTDTVLATVRSLSQGDLSDLKSLVSERIHIIECDVSSEDSIATLPDAITAALNDNGTTKIDVIINNAAIQNSGSQLGLNATGQSILSHIQTNVVGPSAVLQAVLPRLAQGAKVVNITSGVGSLAMLSDGRIGASITPYSISKAALNMLTVHQAKELAGKATVICVDPGHVKTRMGGNRAVVEVEDSASSVLKLINGLKEGDSGKFFLYNGKELEW